MDELRNGSGVSLSDGLWPLPSHRDVPWPGRCNAYPDMPASGRRLRVPWPIRSE